MLKYIGKGALPGIPARDLSDAEVGKYTDEPHLRALGLGDDELAEIKSGKDFLIGTGLYLFVKGKTAVEKDAAAKAAAAQPEQPEPEKEGE
jgi:hypothetical protein